MESKRDIERFIDHWKLGRLSRRDVQKAFASVGLATVLTPIGRGRALADDGYPTCFTWSGYEVTEFTGRTSTSTAHRPTSPFGDEEEAYAKLRAGFKPDITMPCSYKVKKWYDAGLLEPIDTARLTHWPDVIAEPEGPDRRTR